MSDAGTAVIQQAGWEYEVVWAGRGSIFPPPELPEPVVVTEADRTAAQPVPCHDGSLEAAVRAALPGALVDLSARTGLPMPNVMQALLRMTRKGEVVGVSGGDGRRRYEAAGAVEGLLF